MVYTAEEKNRIDGLRETFADYISNNKNFEVVYSEKFGYLSMYIYKGKPEGFKVLESFDAFLEEIFFNISGDVRALNMVGYHDDIDLFPEEIVVTRSRAEDILKTMTQDREYCLKRLDYYLEHVND